MKNGLLKLFWLTQIIIFALCGLVFPNISHAQDEYPPDMITISDDQSMATIILNSGGIDMAKDFIQQLQNTGMLQVKGMLLAGVGKTSRLALSGQPSDLQKAVDLICKQLAESSSREHLVVISAGLRELTQTNKDNVGINLVPGDLNITGTRAWNRNIDASKTIAASLSGTMTLTDVLNMDHQKEFGKVLMSSEVYTPNGRRTVVSDQRRVPVQSIDTNGNKNIQYQELETSITVTPTILDYNIEKPEESLIQLDVIVKVSALSNQKVYSNNVSAPEYSIKNLTTTRMLKANNVTNVIGTFVTDNDIKTSTGFPILGKLPLIKYLFSQESTEKERTTAVLTLAVRILPGAAMGSNLKSETETPQVKLDSDRVTVENNPVENQAITGTTEK